MEIEATQGLAPNPEALRAVYPCAFRFGLSRGGRRDFRRFLFGRFHPNVLVISSFGVPAKGTGGLSEDFGGILGGDVLSRFEITFDLKHERVFLQNDIHFRPDPYRYVTVGIQFSKNEAGSYTVMAVWKDSPAAEGGILPGDQITAINSEPTQLLDIERFSEKLHAREGTVATLTIERDGHSKVVTIKTRKLLCSPDDI
jgi:hypothetical protein